MSEDLLALQDVTAGVPSLPEPSLWFIHYASSRLALATSFHYVCCPGLQNPLRPGRRFFDIRALPLFFLSEK